MADRKKKFPLHILVLADVFFPDTIGGAGRVAKELSVALAKRGHSIRVISRNVRGRLPEIENLAEGIVVHRFDVRSKKGAGFFADEIVNTVKTVKNMRCEWNFDAVCIHQSLSGIGPLLAGQLKETPVLYFFHSPWHEEFIEKRTGQGKRLYRKTALAAGLMKTIEQIVTRKSSRLCVLSSYMAQKAMTIHGLRREKISILPAGVDTSRFCLPGLGQKALRNALDLPSEKTVFFTARNLVPRMGLENLVKAFAGANILSTKAVLVIAGSGELRKRLLQLIESCHLDGKVRLLGHVADEKLIQLYQAADYFVLPTAALEGFGLVILEAMACGTPVVGTNVGAIPEVISAFDPRLVVPDGGAPAIRQCLETIVSNPDLFDYDPSVCRKFVTDRYSWDKTAATFEKVAQSLMASHSNGL